jgi:hypothetical protein
VALLLIVLGPFLGTSLWLDRAGAVASGRVIGKQEGIQVADDGEWIRKYKLAIDFPPSHSGLNPMVGVDSAGYQQARVGDAVTLRYLPCCPIIARLTNRSTVDMVREFVPPIVYAFRWGAWMLAGVAGIVIAAGVGRAAVLGVGVVWAISGFAIDAISPHGVPDAGPQTAIARVRDVRRVDYLIRPTTRSYGWHLTKPFEVATLAFVPASVGDTVVTADAVDAGSVAGLTPGANRAVRYDPAAPRNAQLASGTRTYAARNRPEAILVSVLLVTLMTGAGLLVARRRRS